MTAEQQVRINYLSGEVGLSVPMSGDLANLLALHELKELKVHGINILVNAHQVENYLQAENSAITTEEDLIELLQATFTEEDVRKINVSQVRAKMVGHQFSLDEVGDLVTVPVETFTLVVPQIKVDTRIVEAIIDDSELTTSNKFISFLPPTTEEEKVNPVKCISGAGLRHFLNEMQSEEGNLDMNAQIQIYCALLTNLPDNDPTKMLGLSQMRHLMVYGDAVSNKNLRLALTRVVTDRDE